MQRREIALAVAPGQHGMRGPALALEQFDDHARELGVVVDDQDQRLRIHRASVACEEGTNEV